MHKITMMVIAVAVGLTGVAVHPRGAEAAQSDDSKAISHANYGDAEVWLQRAPGTAGQRQLVYRATADATPQVIDVDVPQHSSLPADWSERLALGLDRAGQLVVVMTSRNGLWWTRIKHTPRLHHVPGTTKHDSMPSVFRGRLAYNHQIGVRSAVRLGTLTAPARPVWSNGSDPNGVWVARETVVGPGGAVAFVIVSDGAESGLYDARLVRPGAKARDIWPGDVHDGPLSLDLAPRGDELAVAGSQSHTVVRYALPSGRRLP